MSASSRPPARRRTSVDAARAPYSSLASAQPRPSARSYGAMVRILNVAAAVRRPARVDDGLVDHEQPRVVGVDLARRVRSTWRAMPLGGAEPGGGAARSTVGAEGEVGPQRGVDREHAEARAATRPAPRPGRPAAAPPSSMPASWARWPPATTARRARDAPARPTSARRRTRSPRTTSTATTGEEQTTRPPCVLDQPDQRVGERLAAADGGGPAEGEPPGGQRRGQEAGARPARVLDRGHRQPEHEGPDHRMLEASRARRPRRCAPRRAR